MNIFNDLRNLNSKLNQELKLIENLDNEYLVNYESIYFLRSIDTMIKSKQIEGAHCHAEAKQNLENGQIQLQQYERLCKDVEGKIAQLGIFMEMEKEKPADDFVSPNFLDNKNVMTNITQNTENNYPDFEKFGIDIVSILKKCKLSRICETEIMMNEKIEFDNPVSTEFETAIHMPNNSQLHNRYTDKEYLNLNIDYSSNVNKEAPNLPKFSTNLLHKINNFENDIDLMSSVTKDRPQNIKNFGPPVYNYNSIKDFNSFQNDDNKNTDKILALNDHVSYPVLSNKIIDINIDNLNEKKIESNAYSDLNIYSRQEIPIYPIITNNLNFEQCSKYLKNENLNCKYQKNISPTKNIDDERNKDPYLQSKKNDAIFKSNSSEYIKDSSLQEFAVRDVKSILNTTYDINNLKNDDLDNKNIYSEIQIKTSNNFDPNKSINFLDQTLTSITHSNLSTSVNSTANLSRCLTLNKHCTKSAEDISLLKDKPIYDFYHSEGNLIKGILKKPIYDSLMSTSILNTTDSSNALINTIDKENISINNQVLSKKYIKEVSFEEYCQFGKDLAKENISLETINKVVKFINKKIAIKNQDQLCLLKSSLSVIFKAKTDFFTEFLINCKRIYCITSEKFGIFYQ